MIGPAIARDEALAEARLAELGLAEAAAGSAWGSALRAALGSAPYLRRLAARRAGTARRILLEGPEAVIEAACAAAHAAPLEADAAGASLRCAKADAHLAVAIADLSGGWDQARVTAALSRFADAAVGAAVRVAAGEEAPGFVVLAMGKLGAHELNYSSDVDLTIFYDPEALGPDAKRIALARTRALAKLLEEQTPEGYVFRVDLRLRPDPAATPPAVTLAAAEHYYQSLGQNWERAAFIKARPAAGDRAAGAAFLASLRPFLWRRHLDYAAIADIRSIKRQISAGGAGLAETGFDLKRDAGGIRAIELIVQTQQLILGGRNPELRVRGTLGALDVLTRRGALKPEDAAALAGAYGVLRDVEHRLQMLEDEQTHAIPADPEARERLAALCGRESFAALAADLSALRAEVARVDERVFGRQDSLADPLGSLSFTGVEDDPATLVTLGRLGFQHPEAVTAAVRGWHHGRIRATRSQRARELLTEVTPALLRALAATGDPDEAFRRFDAFFSALPFGVQTLSLLCAQPHLLSELAGWFVAAPRIAGLLGRYPGVLDSLLEARFEGADAAPIGPWLAARVAEAGDLERQLDATRRIKRDESVRLALHLLAGRISGAEAGRAFAGLAEACIASLSEAVAADLAARGRAPPGRWAVCGLGKLGGRELSFGSDLDLMLLYDAEEGGRAAYARFAQALIAALSAPTAEGPLYEIDMNLRPSGLQGPIAVRFATFERYYREEAWTWELQALTRLRPIAGAPDFLEEVRAAAARALKPPRLAPAQMLEDVRAMRARLDAEKPSRGLFDLKRAPGGLLDLEFVAQGLMLVGAARGLEVVRANTGEALEALCAAALLDPGIGRRLREAWRLRADLHQLLQVCVEGVLAPEKASAALRSRLAREAGAERFEALAARLEEEGPEIRALCERALASV